MSKQARIDQPCGMCGGPFIQTKPGVWEHTCPDYDRTLALLVEARERISSLEYVLDLAEKYTRKQHEVADELRERQEKAREILDGHVSRHEIQEAITLLAGNKQRGNTMTYQQFNDFLDKIWKETR